MIEVVQAGFHTSVQDLGRHGLRSSGIGQSGAMDGWALRLVNALIGNAADAAAIEITLGRSAFRFQADTVFAIGGADGAAMLDGTALPNWWVRTASAGQVLRFGAPRSGVRTYLTVQGGIDVPTMMGSRATDTKGAFGGFEGRLLAKGDVLCARGAAPARQSPGFGLSVRRLDPYPELADGVPVIGILPATAWADFTDEAHARLTGETWQVSPQSNRIGSRLEGPELVPRRVRELHSHGILPGVVQVPPSGQPIVQLCDGNTCGGYPVIATIIQPQLHLFAQLAPGARLRLRQTDMAGALAAQASQQARLAEIESIAGAARVRAGLPGAAA